jgi:putative transposase
MAVPSRHSDPHAIQYDRRTFFVTTSCDGHRRLLQSDRMARLLIDTLLRYRDQGRYQLHEFVVMPDHLHVLLTIGLDMTVERAVQLVKGGYSYRVSHELGVKSEVWQRGFSDSRILTAAEYHSRANYIGENPVRAGLAQAARDSPYSSAACDVRLDPSPWPAAKGATARGFLRHD